MAKNERGGGFPILYRVIWWAVCTPHYVTGDLGPVIKYMRNQTLFLFGTNLPGFGRAKQSPQ